MKTEHKNEIDLDLARQRTELSAQRTRDAADRTLMAWIRTGLAMIAFGFSVFKVFQVLVEQRPEGDHDIAGTRILTLALVGLGTVLLVAAMLQYRTTMRQLTKENDLEHRFPLALWAAAIMALIGAYGVLNILFHVGGA
jgi:putative membrane protein